MKTPNRLKRAYALVCVILLSCCITSAHVNAPTNIAVTALMDEGGFLYKIEAATFNIPPLQNVIPGGEKPSMETVRFPLEDFFAHFCPVHINGIKVKPVLKEIKFTDVVRSHLFKQDVSMSLANMELHYPVMNRPETIAMTWSLYVQKPVEGWGGELDLDQDPQEIVVPCNFYGNEDYLVFHPSESEYIWENPPDLETLKQRIAQAATVRHRPVSLPMISISAIILLLGFISVASWRHWPKTWLAAGCFLCIVAGASTSRVMIVEIYPFWQGRVDMPTDEEAHSILTSLLENIYRAFDYKREEDIYDALAQSIGWDALPKIYSQIRQALIQREASGTISSIKGMEITDLKVQRREERTVKGPALLINATWNTSGVVAHQNHSHNRITQYNADFTLLLSKKQWIISDIAIKEQEAISIKSNNKLPLIRSFEEGSLN